MPPKRKSELYIGEDGKLSGCGEWVLLACRESRLPGSGRAGGAADAGVSFPPSATQPAAPVPTAGGSCTAPSAQRPFILVALATVSSLPQKNLWVLASMPPVSRAQCRCTQPAPRRSCTLVLQPALPMCLGTLPSRGRAGLAASGSSSTAPARWVILSDKILALLGSPLPAPQRAPTALGQPSAIVVAMCCVTWQAVLLLSRLGE